MLRIIFWKLGFEWSHLLRVLWPRNDERVYYFAFGANLCADVLKRRRIEIYESFDYVLKGTELRFSQPGFYRNHGYASAEPDAEKVIYGKMYLITRRDARRMDYFEGVPMLNVHIKINDEFDGNRFFYYRAEKPRTNLKPTQEYLSYITNAYIDMPIVPRDYISRLMQTKVLDEFLPQNETGKFIRDIESWPKFLHFFLRKYEGLCLLLVEFLWNRSAVQWLIR